MAQKKSFQPSPTRQRERTLAQFRSWTEKPLQFLALVWIALLVVELTRGANPVVHVLGTVIWAIFVVEFAIGFSLAPLKMRYLRKNWLSALSLAAPALRILNVAARFAHLARIGQVAKGAGLLRVVGSMNRAMNALSRSMGRRGFGYVVTLTVIVTFAGAAGMFAFEKDAQGGGFQTYTTALWWTAMMITTIGSEYWPKTAEGRLLCLLLGIFGFAVFSYMAGTLASFFVDRDQGDEGEGRKIREEIRALREDIRDLKTKRPADADPEMAGPP